MQRLPTLLSESGFPRFKDVQDVEKNSSLKPKIFLDKYSYKILLIL